MQQYARTPAGCEQEITGNTTMITNRKIALAAAVILGRGFCGSGE